MRGPTGAYRFPHLNLAHLSEVTLLSHYQQSAIPQRSDIHLIRVISLSIDQGVFGMGGSLGTNEQIKVIQDDQSLTISCSCAIQKPHLCYHEMLVLLALMTQKNYRPFFDREARTTCFVPHAERYGLENESTLDDYFSLSYDKGNLRVHPKQGNILAVDNHLPEKELRTILANNHRKAVLPAPQKKRILVLRKHRFYEQLHIDMADVGFTPRGKLKPPFDVVDPRPLLWTTNDITDAKCYAALSSLQQQQHVDDLDSNTLDALCMLCQYAQNFPIYYHDRTISEKISSKSLREIKLALLDASIEVSVFKRQPFYEITAYLLWNDERLPLKSLTLQHRYFFCRQDQFFLIGHLALLRLLEYFKKNAEILLVHASKYDEFVRHTLDPLEQLVHINYAYVRPATATERKVFENSQERLIYFSQENSYINITPVMRYGTIEVPLSSKKKIRSLDANGNMFQLDRAIDAEDRFRHIVVHQHPDFEAQQQEMDYFYLHHQLFFEGDWFLNAFEAWRNEGITLLGFQEMGLTKVNPYKANIAIDIMSGHDWFNVKVSASFGKQKASLTQLHRAIRNKSKYVTLDDGSVGMIPEEWIAKIARYFQFAVLEADLLKIPKIGPMPIDELFEKERIPEEIRAEAAGLQKRLAGIKKRDEIISPRTLHATLRPYQLDGLYWLHQLDQLNLGGCLADDMGLGKTIQIVAHLLLLAEQGQCGPHLIIAPTSLIFNWQQEFEKFAPTLRVVSLQGTSRAQTYSRLTQYDVVLISYGLLLSDISKLKRIMFNNLVLDESQAIKNPNSERYKAARLLKARTRFVLTGTPIENSTLDLYGQLSFACPGLLGSKQFFKDTYAIPIDRFEDRKRAQTLQEKTAPFILRRTKKQVATELPEKTEVVIYCEMGEQQREIYNRYEAELRDYLQGITADEWKKNSIHVLAGLTRLRQICNAPVLLKEGYDAHISAKLDALLEHLQAISSEHKVLVFSQFVGMLDLIKDALDKARISSTYLTGKTKNRGEVVEAFQNDATQRVFLVSLKAGGVGLNLTAADYVFLVDPWWNPAVENQAIDRSYRIGQTKKVVAVRMICPDTVEEKIQRLQDKKRALAGGMVKAETDIIRQFNKQDWLALLQ
ncbi:DEAD/DEAH box helicase [Sphingobacterium griseoflavum]|uniref:DNA helicase n=1 Tax=Sphingobacterium griseoflavum TaxID=1474952 RepID=A0ABQ3HSQ4_9SPHI|nr:DEAD/DEAH box helicase [Sphingobacterium griseoflavum]GHE31063.1 hypothetical protein GCM10017764_12640 [Sphingobacterium griseoflavum]